MEKDTVTISTEEYLRLIEYYKMYSNEESLFLTYSGRRGSYTEIISRDELVKDFIIEKSGLVGKNSDLLYEIKGLEEKLEENNNIWSLIKKQIFG